MSKLWIGCPNLRHTTLYLSSSPFLQPATVQEARANGTASYGLHNRHTSFQPQLQGILYYRQISFSEPNSAILDLLTVALSIESLRCFSCDRILRRRNTFQTSEVKQTKLKYIFLFLLRQRNTCKKARPVLEMYIFF